jgi:hypothetical protein
MKKPDGTLARGGHWAGGLAFLTCSQKAVELAQRPQNLPAVRALCHADAYFIDTTYAAGLQECSDPKHPLTRLDDMKWKQALSDYARSVFGIFGSECGREWAIPHSDFFEGFTGVSGRSYHDDGLQAEVGGTVIPLFEIVYRDCIAMYGKYGYDIFHSADYVLQHISLGRPLNYHNVPAHLYWKDYSLASGPAPAVVDVGIFARADHGWAEGLHPLDRFVKNTAEILSPLNELTSRDVVTDHEFLTLDRKVQRTTFGARVQAIVNGSTRAYAISSKRFGETILPPGGFVIEAPEFVAFLAQKWNGVDYPEAVLFTLRSLDAKPIESSAKLRVYHGFGNTHLRLGGKEFDVQRETILP